MALVLPRSTLKPARAFTLGVDASRKVVRAEDVRALHAAAQAVEQANAQADEILRQARQVYESERKRGYAEGREEARLEHAEQMIENVARNVEYFSRVEDRVVNLVMQALQKIMDGFDDRERVLITVRSILAVVRNQRQITLRLAPDQVELVRSRVSELLAAYPGVGYLDLVGDGRLKGDACILESEIGLVEASIDGQLAAIRAAFQKVLGSRVS